MMRAKLFGYMERQAELSRRYPLSDNSLPARHARAISTYRCGDMRDAIAQTDTRAQERFPIGSLGWVRADYIVAFKGAKKSPLAIVP